MADKHLKCKKSENRFVSISFTKAEADLYKWTKGNKNLEISRMFKGILKRKKKELEEIQGLDPKQLKAKIKNLTHVIGFYNQFIIKKQLEDEWFDFYTSDAPFIDPKNSSPFHKEIKVQSPEYMPKSDKIEKGEVADKKRNI